MLLTEFILVHYYTSTVKLEDDLYITLQSEVSWMTETFLR